MTVDDNVDRMLKIIFDAEVALGNNPKFIKLIGIEQDTHNGIPEEKVPKADKPKAEYGH